MSALSNKDRARRLAIVNELSHLSKDGWRHAKPCDYEPLERELRALEAKERRAVRR